MTPYEFSDKYPFDHMIGIPSESELIKERYYELTKKRIHSYLNIHKYNAYLSYLRQDSISFKALIDACDALNLELVNKPLNEKIELDKDSDLVLTYPKNLDNLIKMIEETL